MSGSTFISEFNRAIRGLDALDISSLRHRELSCIEALQACNNSSRTRAKSALDPYEKRQQTEDADWVYDDFLLFSLLCCFVKFGEFEEMLRRLVSLRRRNEQGKRFTFIQDAERVLQERTFSAHSMFTVVISDLLEIEVTDSSVIRSAHAEAAQMPLETQVTIFEEAIGERCKEIIAELSISSSMSSSVVVRNLWRRTRGVAMIAYLSVITTITCVLAVTIWLSFFGGTELSSTAGKIISLGAIGVVAYLWRIKGIGYNGCAYFLIWLAAGKAGYQAMRSFNKH